MRSNALRARIPIFVGMLIFVGQHSLGALDVAARQTHHVRSWKVKDSTVRLTIADGQLVCASRDADAEIIPLSAIRSLGKETLIRKPVKQAVRELSQHYKVDWDDFNSAVAQDPRVAMLAPAMPAVQPLTMLAAQAFLAPFRGIQVNHHFVHVTWREHGEDQSEIFRMSGRDADSLLEELRRLTGKPVSQVKVLEELEKGKGTIHYFKISTELAVGRSSLFPGTYPVLFVQTSAEEGVLYFLLRGSLTQDDILTVTSVKISPFVEGQSPNARWVQDINGTLRLAELRVGPHLLRLNRASEE